MILQALKEYYDRMSSEPNSSIAPFGWEKVEISFIIVLKNDGTLINIEDLRENTGKKNKGKMVNVPLGEIRTSGIKANLLWDSAEYIFGLGSKGKEKKDEFVKRLKNELSGINDVNPVIQFLENFKEYDMENIGCWNDIKDSVHSNLSFKLENDTDFIFENREVKERLNAKYNNLPLGTCLVTGKNTRIKDLHKEIKGVAGINSSGAKIVSFNLDSFKSYGKENGLNSPVGIEAEFAYTTALNTLLKKDSKQKIVIGSLTMVFWAKRQDTFENVFSYLFQKPPRDDPNSGTRKINELFEGVKKGYNIEEKDRNYFFVLGLGPNSARIVIRFWKSAPINEIAEKIKQYFEDFTIVKSDKQPKYYSLLEILKNLSIRNETENIPPDIEAKLMMSILNGSPYPASLIQAVMRRILSDSKERVNSVRAATIKAYLNSYYRLYSDKSYKEIYMGLDIEQPSMGYQLGRLFATLERIQERANPDINSTIRERFYGAACVSPITVFPTLLRLKNHHISKIDKESTVIYFEQLIGEIMGKISIFPPNLNLHEQGLFSIGYYHQRQIFYTKKDKNNNEVTVENMNTPGGDDK